ncbi:lipoprotein [Spiroplasma endosymbiont of Glossina fuscipes fuscipes]|uniref:lipoprotein n=1 Tax=Spiroplasma endosymbiont of Glossina fuscipes fuscipes TaxID=2004463 RepID=UPI003CF081C0
MKKLLSILGAITLVGTVTPNVISCHNKKVVNNDDAGTAKDLEVLDEIEAKAIEKINQKIKNIPYVDSMKNNLSKIYSKVNKGDTEPYRLKLNNSDDNKLATYFINNFTKIFDDVNRDLQNEYSNYFTNELPLTLDDQKNIVKVSFIDVENLRNKFPSDVNPEPFSAVRVDYKATIQLKFKQMYASFEITNIYNVTENVDTLRAFSDKAVVFLIENIKDYFLELETVDLSENKIFKPLYDQMIWDFSKDTTELNGVLKNSFKEYIASKTEFKNISINYNDTDLIKKEQDGQLTADNKGFNGLSKTKKARDLSLANWVVPSTSKNNPWKRLLGATVENFVNFYKTKIGDVFNIDKDDNLNLGTFKINLNYLNVFGLGLSGNVKDKNDEDLTIALNLSGKAIDKKLTNWGKIVVQFLKYSDDLGEHTRVIVSNIFNILTVSKQDFKQMVIKNQKNGLKSVVKIIIDGFKNSDEAKDLEDLELFNLITHPLLSNPIGHSRRYEPNILVWDKEIEEKWAVMFTFGKSFDAGLYYSFVLNQNSDEIVDLEVSSKGSE